MSNGKNKLNQQEYEKLIKLLSQRKQNKQKEIPLKTVISALEELDLLEELENNDLKAIQENASNDISQKNKNSGVINKIKLFLGLVVLGGLVYTGIELYPKIASLTNTTEETKNANSANTTNNKTSSTLTPGESVSNQGFSIMLENPSFANLPDDDYFMTFEMVISNNSGGELVTQITGKNLSVVADNGKTYSEIRFGSDYIRKSIDYLDIYSLAPGETRKLSFGVRGKLNENVKNIMVKVKDAGRIKSSKWRIEVPR